MSTLNNGAQDSADAGYTAHIDRNGVPLRVGDRVEFHRIALGPEGGDALGWAVGTGIPGTVVAFDDHYYAGMVLVELDEKPPLGPYPAPHDVTREWARMYYTVRTDTDGAQDTT